MVWLVWYGVVGLTPGLWTGHCRMKTDAGVWAGELYCTHRDHTTRYKNTHMMLYAVRDR